MIEILFWVVVVGIAMAVLLMSHYLHRSGADADTRSRARVHLHQIRRTRELTELRLAMRRDAQQLRRALDRDFDTLDES